MTSLKEHLQALPDAQRAALAVRWRTDTSPDAILAQMHNPVAARCLWLALSPNARVCLYHVLIASTAKGVKRESLRKKTRLALPAFEQAVDHLKCLFLLKEEVPVHPVKLHAPKAISTQDVPVLLPFQESLESLRHTGYELFSPYADRSTMTLARLLESQAWETVESQASMYRVKRLALTAPYLRLEQCEQIAAAMKNPQLVFDALHHVETAAQRLFLWLCEHEGHTSFAEAKQSLQLEDDRPLLVVLAQLEKHALAFSTLTQAAEHRIFIHPEIYATIKQEALDRAADERIYAFFPLQEEPAVLREGQPTLLHDLATIVWWVHHTLIEPTKEQKLPKRIASKIRSMLHGLPRLAETGEDQYTDLLFSAACSLEVLQCAIPYGEEKARYAPGPALATWGTLGLVQQTQRWLAWWAGKTRWVDLKADGKPIFSYDWDSYHARQLLLNQLKECLPQHSYGIESLLYALWRQSPIILHDDHYGPRSKTPASLRGRRKKWMQQYGSLYVGLLTSTLFECGLITLGYTKAPRSADEPQPTPSTFCVTALGASVLETSLPIDHSADATAEQQASLIVQPNYDVLLLHTELPLVYELIRFTELYHVERVSMFRLIKPALLRGMASGLRREQMIAFLEQHSLHALPQNIAYTLHEWSSAYQDALLSEMIVVELTGEKAVHELKHALAQKQIEVRTLAPGIHALAAERASFLDIRRMLEKMGIVVHGQPAHLARGR